MSDNAFFYWMALPIEWPHKKFLAFDAELKTKGGEVFRSEDFRSEGNENVFIIFTLPEYMGDETDRLATVYFRTIDDAWVRDATENTKLIDLGKIPAQMADLVRYNRPPPGAPGYKVTTDEEAAHAYMSENPPKKGGGLGAALVIGGALVVTILILSKKR